MDIQDQPAGSDQGYESQKPRIPHKVHEPTKQELDEHIATGHASYRTWCPHCVKAKGQANPHRDQESGSDYPELHLDYGYMGTRDAPGATHIMGRDSTSGNYVSTMLDSKGRGSRYAIAHLVGWIRGLGHRKVIVRSDNEPSLLALLGAVSKEVPDIEWVLKTSPEYDHQANGGAENAVRECKGQVRAARSQLEAALKEKLDDSEAIIAWIPRHTANCINRYRVGADGKTSEQRRTGRAWRRPTVGFGERCYFRPAMRPGPHKNDGEERMKEGVYIGHHERSGASMFLTPSGLYRGVGIHRLPESTRWDVNFVKSCRGLPWDVKARQAPQAGGNAAPPVVTGGVVIPPPPVIPVSGRKRRRATWYVTKADVQQYGGTDECAACVALATGQPVTAGHDEKCRQRFEELMSKVTDEDNPAGADRYRRFVQKRDSTEEPVAEEAKENEDMDDREVPAAQAAGAPEATLAPPVAQEAAAQSASGSGAGPHQEVQAAVQARLRRTEPDTPSAEQGAEATRARIERRGEKRESETDVQDLDPSADVVHVDDDVQISAAAGASTAAPDTAMPEADAAAPDADADTTPLSLCELSAVKQQFVSDIKQQLNQSYYAHGMDATNAEVTCIAECLSELSAVDAKKVMSNRKRHPTEIALRAGICLDLLRTEGGNAYDLSTAHSADQARQLQKKEHPKLLLCSEASPMLQAALDATIAGDPVPRAAEFERSQKNHLVLIGAQLEEGHHFLYERIGQEGAHLTSPEFEELKRHHRVIEVAGPLIDWRKTPKNTQTLIKARVTWYTSSPHIANDLRRYMRAQGGRAVRRGVERLASGLVRPGRHPPRVVASIYRGLREQLYADEDDQMINAFDAGPIPEDTGFEWMNEDEEDAVTAQYLKWEAEDAEDDGRYYDDVNGGYLDPQKAAAAREEEIAWILKRHVLDKVPRSQCTTKPIPIKWIDTMKLGGRYRSRLVAREIKRAKKFKDRLRPEECFSAMPPSESLRLLVSHMMTDSVDSKGRPLCLASWDVSRAHFYGLATRNLCVELPEELKEEGKDLVGRLVRTMYGTEDAAKIWGDTWPQQLEKHNFTIGTANRALFRGPNGEKGFCYGDDFVLCASEEDLKAFGKILEEAYDVRMEALIGFGPHLGDQMKILNRFVKIDRENDRVTIEADQRHIEALIEELGLQQAKVAVTPRVKLTETQVQEREATPLLQGSRITQFRSCTMRAKYLEADRADISESVKCLSQYMAKPREGHFNELTRLVKYLKGERRHMTEFIRQEPCDLTTSTDSDWAGDVVNRRSTSGVAIQRGRHLIRHMCNLQNVVSLSSAEAEFYALTKGSAATLGVQSHLRDWAMELSITMQTDSSSGMAFGNRRGLGKMRHIQTRYLWIQEHVASRTLRIKKIDGTLNLSDILTKAHGKDHLLSVCRQLGQVRVHS